MSYKNKRVRFPPKGQIPLQAIKPNLNSLRGFDENKLPWSAVLALTLILAACQSKYGLAIYVPESVSTAIRLGGLITRAKA